jgi:hypothetical protein
VADHIYSVERAARQIVDQWRSDIAAAMIQLEAAKAILKGSQWLLVQWEERRRADAVSGGFRLPAYDEVCASGVISVEPEDSHRRPRKRRFKIDAPSGRRSRSTSV